MAIKINNITPEMSVWGMKLMGARNTPSEPSYAYEYTIKVGSNGEIENNTIWNLGRCGDKEVCKLKFNIEDIKEHNEEYNVYCVFKDKFDNKRTYEVIISDDKKTGVLVLPEEVTQQEGQYEMILVFQEAKSHNSDNTPNVPKVREYFVSSVFKGKVNPSAWMYVGGTSKVIELNTPDGEAIYKEEISIETSETDILSPKSNNLGNKGDRYVKPLSITGLDSKLNEVYLYFFINDMAYKYHTDINHLRVWVPQEITDLRYPDISKWSMVLVTENKTQRLVYNTLEFEVTDNWLTADDLYVDINKNYVLLRDKENILLLDSEGVILTAKTAPTEE